jgi:PAS domain S-box-containing protein
MPVDYERVVKVIGDAIVVSDASGAIDLWNPAAERLFGFTQAEALGNSLDLIIPERLRERHWAGYGNTMASGKTRYGRDVLRVPAVHKDGRALSICIYGRIALWAATRGERNRGRDSRRNDSLRRRAKLAQAHRGTREEYGA